MVLINGICSSITLLRLALRKKCRKIGILQQLYSSWLPPVQANKALSNMKERMITTYHQDISSHGRNLNQIREHESLRL